MSDRQQESAGTVRKAKNAERLWFAFLEITTPQRLFLNGKISLNKLLSESNICLMK